MFWRRKQKKRQEPCCSAVVVAAGSSTRMGMDKLMLPLDETPVIVYTLRAVQAAPSVGEIILVTREDLIVPMSQLCQDYAISKVTKVVRGGGQPNPVGPAGHFGGIRRRPSDRHTRRGQALCVGRGDRAGSGPGHGDWRGRTCGTSEGHHQGGP